VWIVDGRLVKFKKETGKTGDSDYHLVISDETLLYSPGGSGTQVSPHSLVAEIPDPNCVGGRYGAVTTPSIFATQLQDVQHKLFQQFPNIHPGWNDGGGIPVRLTGVGFYDRDHDQTGRSLHGLELHPLLNIEFNPVPVTPPAGATVALGNPMFENGNSSWTTTADVITNNANEPARSGQWKAWLGGYGTAHTDKLSQQVTLPAAADAISLTFYLHIDTEEESQQVYDRLRVRVRKTNGDLLSTLKTYSNLNAATGYELQSLDLTPFMGRTIRISLEATEDSGSITSFVADDFAIRVEGP
jgi:hypothetical protein